ncbi:hypothetical protein TL16_g07293 [Triparma laevis f. inornata]|uniref:TNFR-Cys domain-containing protein n=1 Tax=Triparma laevis f. inornata TaxID=1714386 RepID=A0A9W7ARN6_9STRA|nr:hypothetical protein TL16_g07293 [Triparma laevis f. inornata]
MHLFRPHYIHLNDPPLGTNVWRIYCDNTWTDTEITIETVTVGATVCLDCSAGKYSGSSSATCSSCASGKYLTNSATGVESSACTSCSTGKYSGAASATCSSCASGKYLANLATGVESSACTSCSTGQYSGSASATCSSCAAGKYLANAATSDEPSACSACTPGKYSGVSSPACTICAAGTYTISPATSTCTVCPSGKYNPDQATSTAHHNFISTCVACGLGTKLADDGEVAYNHDSAEDCRECNPGFFSNDPDGASSCQQCAEYLISPSGSSTCGFCPAGYDCSGGTTEMCALGTYSNGGTVGCEPYYCAGAADRHMCHAGSYQPDASQASCLACPPGKYQEVPGQDACVDCPAGYFCTERTVNPIACGSAALFCPLNSEIVQAADEGHYTTPLSTETTTKREGQAVCEAGFACNGGLKTPCDSTGQYADETGLSACKTAPAGKKPTSDRQNIESCELGFASSGALDECVPCDGTGQYADETGLSACKTAPAGKKPTSNRQGVEGCELGSASPGAHDECVPCDAISQYADVAGLAACKTAPAGKKPTLNRQGIESCPAGKYSTGGVDECENCGIGETSDPGAAGCRTCLTCGLGKYQIEECTTNTPTQCGDCVAGKASMGGAVRECTHCDGPGEYSEAKASVCKIAPAGYKPTETGHSLKTGIEFCPKNIFSIGATDECTECADGGHSNPGDGSCEKCSTGEYYDEPSNECELCPLNTFTISGAADINGCEECPAGGHSQPGAGYCDQCRSGKYYDEPSNLCKLCPAGKKYAENEGNTECKFCDDDEMLVGSTTLQNGTSSASGCICPAGEYVQFSKSTCQKVPEGVETTINAMTVKTLNVKEGYWRTNASSFEVLPCLAAEHCLGGSDPEKQCSYIFLCW